MSDDFQIEIPPSFRALYLDARGRLRLRPRELLARYELCEDLAQQLTETARPVHLDIGLPTDEVLERIGRGLHAPEAGLAEGEPGWVLRRLAELLDWPPLADAAA